MHGPKGEPGSMSSGRGPVNRARSRGRDRGRDAHFCAGGKSFARPGMQDARFGEPVVGELLDRLPLGLVSLASSPERAPPEVDHVVAECGQ